MDKLPDDILNEIMNRIPPISALQMKSLNHLFSSNTNLSFDLISRFKQYLKNHYILDPDQFLKVIDKYQAFIGGSLMLNFISGDDWKPNDIDVYCSIDEIEISKNPFLQELVPLIDFQKCGYDYHNYSANCCLYINKTPITSDFYLNYIRTKSNMSQIVSDYDLEFCKISYYQGRIYIFNPESIINRSSSFSATANLEWEQSAGVINICRNKYSRYRRYRQRDYTLLARNLETQIMIDIMIEYDGYYLNSYDQCQANEKFHLLEALELLNKTFKRKIFKHIIL